MDKCWKLNRKKDIICLILSYPPFNSRIKEEHKNWILNVLEVTQEVRELMASSMDKETNISELSSEISRLLDHSIHDIEAYVPPHIIEEMQWGTLWSRAPTKKMLVLATDFAIRQILHDTVFRRIRISGTDGKSFMSRWKIQQQISEMFSTFLQVNATSCKTTEDIEDSIARELGLSTCNKQDMDELLKNKSFLIILDDTDPMINQYEVGARWWNSEKIQKIVSRHGLHRLDSVGVDLEIRLEDHLLSWQLFHTNVGNVLHSSPIRYQAVNVLKHCSGHLLVAVLMARALKGVENIRVWEHASHAFDLLATSETNDRILFNALAFILGRLDSAKECIKSCESYLDSKGTEKIYLIEKWMKGGLIRTLDEGEEIIQELSNAFLLESCGNGGSVRMRDEIQKELVNLYKTEMNPILHEPDGRGLTEAPKDEAWEEISEMHLMNNKISKLPGNPKCPKLNVLFLQGNNHLRVIPPSFFEHMPILQILDMSQTKIKYLPESLFKLVQLRKFILRGCKLLKELPSEVGELHHLQVLDLEGTEIINLPIAVEKLTNLICLKVSFYGYNGHSRKDIQSSIIIPQNVISNLFQLEELSIDVNPEDERWNVNVKSIVKEICNSNRLEALKVYLPESVLLKDFRNGSLSINLPWMHFKFVIGSHLKRVISRLPGKLAAKFDQEERCLKYVNGRTIEIEIQEVLQQATAFFLDRHLTVSTLSEFGIGNMKNLKSCAICECNEMETIVALDDYEDAALESLELLNVFHMKKLRSILKWEQFRQYSPAIRVSIYRHTLSNLKSLALHTCPQLTTIFTVNFLQRLRNLEELVVEDCPEVNSILSLDVHTRDATRFPRIRLPKLKKISLHYMPKLVSICYGLLHAPRLEWISFYDCPSFKILSEDELSSNELKVIIGEADWWSALKWNKSRQSRLPNLDAIFVPIERDIDLMTQLTEINNQLQAQMREKGHSQQSGYFFHFLFFSRMKLISILSNFIHR